MPKRRQKKNISYKQNYATLLVLILKTTQFLCKREAKNIYSNQFNAKIKDIDLLYMPKQNKNIPQKCCVKHFKNT